MIPREGDIQNYCAFLYSLNKTFGKMDSVHNTFFGEVKNGGYETVVPCNEVVVFGIKADRRKECKVTPMLCGSFCIVLVADGTAHLSVNYKETQTANMKIGDRVRLTVDAIPGVEYIGAIEAISNATAEQGVTLVPLPSAGKTSVAAHVGHPYLDEQREYKRPEGFGYPE